MRSTMADALVLSLSVQSLAAAGTASGSKVSWRKVQQLSPGTAITLTATGTSPRRCYVLAADDTSLRFLNVSDLGLAPETVKVLREIAAAYPDVFVVRPDTTVELGKGVVLRSSGLFVASQRVADYDQVVQTVARGDVERGAVLLADAQVKAGLERSTEARDGGNNPAGCALCFLHVHEGCLQVTGRGQTGVRPWSDPGLTPSGVGDDVI